MKSTLLKISIVTILFISLIISLSLLRTISTDKEIIFEINKGETHSTIIKKLEKSEIINLSKFYIILFKISNKLTNKLSIKHGEYRINPETNYYNLFKQFITGEIFLRRITITEGETVSQVIKSLKKNKYITGTIKNIPNEGYLLPETYFFKKGDDINNIINQAKTAMDTALSTEWNNQNNSKTNIINTI